MTVESADIVEKKGEAEQRLELKGLLAAASVVVKDRKVAKEVNRLKKEDLLLLELNATDNGFIS
jgi:hypothetical protein